MPCVEFSSPIGIIMMAIMMLFWLVLLAALVTGIIYLVRYLGVPAGVVRPKEEALDIAKKRYAKGEISKDEFEQIKKDLGS